MQSPRILDLLSDAVNPIVVKELRQALQSRFVVAVLLLFLLAQLLILGIYLMVQTLEGSMEYADFEAGRTVFMILNWILLATCMLVIPAYSGFRLAAERTEVQVDLLFIGALPPRSILSGKVLATLVLAVIVFSACAPFMTLTYFLRGIDLPTIFFLVALDFLLVALMVMVALFLAVVPANRVFKVLLALAGLLYGLIVFIYTIAFTYNWLEIGGIPWMESPEFWVTCLAVLLDTLGFILFLFVCSVGLISPLSANRMLSVRVGVSLFCLASGVLLAWCAVQVGDAWPITTWFWSAGLLLSLCLLIAVNEREQWGPRMARTIPRRWWLRRLAFLFYSGAAGGVVWACLMCAGFWIAVPVLTTLQPGFSDSMWIGFLRITLMFGYTYCYALTAVFLRCTIIKIQPVHTWILALALLALGSLLPYLASFLVSSGNWAFSTHFLWLLTNPIAGMIIVGDPVLGADMIPVVFVLAWAVLATVLNGRWFVRQMRNFRPYSVRTARGAESLSSLLSATPTAATKGGP